MSSTLKTIVRRVRRYGRTILGRDFWAEPEIRCSREHVGSEYGGWWIRPDWLNAQSVVMSVGVGSDVSFDTGMIQRFGCEVHAYDPTPKAVAWIRAQKLPAQLKFHPLGLADYDGDAFFALPGDHPEYDSYVATTTDTNVAKTAADKATCAVRRLKTMMAESGLSRVDVLKMDIEGSEYSVLDEILKGDIRPPQLLVEYHYHQDGRKGVERTVKSIKALRAAGYKIFARSDYGLEFSFCLEKPAR